MMCTPLPQVPVPRFLCHLVPFNKRNGTTFSSEGLGAFQEPGELEAVTTASSLPSLAGTLELEAPLWAWAGLPLRAERHFNARQVPSDLSKDSRSGCSWQDVWLRT